MFFPFNLNLDLGNLNIGPKPIPVPAAACPSLRLVHDDSAHATALWNPVWSGTETPSEAAEFWPEMGPTLQRLDESLRAALPRVPAPIAAQFRITIRDVEFGQAGLLYFRDPHRYVARQFVNSSRERMPSGRPVSSLARHVPLRLVGLAKPAASRLRVTKVGRLSACRLSLASGWRCERDRARCSRDAVRGEPS